MWGFLFHLTFPFFLILSHLFYIPLSMGVVFQFHPHSPFGLLDYKADPPSADAVGGVTTSDEGCLPWLLWALCCEQRYPCTLVNIAVSDWILFSIVETLVLGVPFVLFVPLLDTSLMVSLLRGPGLVGACSFATGVTVFGVVS